jgi:hypothetical protein
MIRITLAAAVAALAFAASPALADEAADCTAGIQFIEAEIAKAPAAKVLGELNEALADAKREQGEQEYDECLEAVQEAKDAVGAG